MIHLPEASWLSFEGGGRSGRGEIRRGRISQQKGDKSMADGRIGSGI